MLQVFELLVKSRLMLSTLVTLLVHKGNDVDVQVVRAATVKCICTGNAICVNLLSVVISNIR